MLGKITGALIRREADAYRAQGLHEEALALFKKSLRSGPQLPSDVKDAFEQQIRQLEAEMVGTVVEEHEQLSDEQLAVIRQGWCDDASIDDLAVSAHALHAMGCYGNALEEFVVLIQRGYSAHRIIGPMARCLAHLNPPREIADAFDRLSAALFQDSKNSFALKLSLAEEMIKARFGEHSMELSRDLNRMTGIPSSYRFRLEALARDLKSLSRQKVLPPAVEKESSIKAASVFPSVVWRIWAAVKAIPGRMRLSKGGS